MSLEERVARLEVQSEQNTELLSTIDKKLTELTEQFLRHKGFMGGVIFTVSSIWAIMIVVIDFLLRK